MKAAHEIYTTRSGEAIPQAQQFSHILENRTTWVIPYDEKWERVLFQIKEANISILTIRNPQKVAMFACISSIHFQKLVELNITRIELATTEPILTMKTPQLEYLHLNGNQLTNIRSLRKMAFRGLRQLYLQNNRIIDPSPLAQLHSDRPLKIIISYTSKPPMQFHRTVFETNQIQDYSPFFKLPPNAHLLLKPGLLRCINQRQLGAMFERKFIRELNM